MNSISANLNVMIKACEKASKILIRDFGELEKLQISIKGPNNFVTNADRKVEEIIIQELEKSKKKFSILTEERGFIENKIKIITNGVNLELFELSNHKDKKKIKKNIIPMVVDDFFPNCTGKLKYFNNFKKIITLRNPIGILYENLSRSRVDRQISGHPLANSISL